mgnify:CR=1 FL=1
MSLHQKIPKDLAIDAIRKLVYVKTKPVVVGFCKATGVVGASQTLEDYYTTFMCAGLTPGTALETGSHILQVLSPKETAALLESDQPRKLLSHG